MVSNDLHGHAGKKKGYKPRRQYVINAAFQWKCCATIAVVVLLASFMISCVLYGVLHHQARMRMLNPMTYTAEVPWVIFAFAVGFAALTAAGVGIWSVFMTHRICGPLNLLQGYVRELAGGRFPKVRPLRRKDEFKELMASFGKAVASLKTSKQAEVTTLTKVLNITRAAIDSDDCDRKEALVAVASHIEPLRNVVQACFDESGHGSSRRDHLDWESSPNKPVTIG